MAVPPRQGTNRRVIYETLRRKVLTLELAPGAPLSENELAVTLGGSRTPIREGLILLAEEGLVQVFPQVGSFVSQVDLDRVRDAHFLCEAVELAALGDIPAAPDPDVLDGLRANLDRQRALNSDDEELFVLDEAFHQGLLRLSGHERTWPTVVAAKGHVDRARRLGFPETNSAASFADQHQAVLSAIVDADLSRARETMRTHLRAVFTDVERIHGHAPELFGTVDGATPVRRNAIVCK